MLDVNNLEYHIFLDSIRISYDLDNTTENLFIINAYTI